MIPVYVEKWRAIALSTKHIDRQKATEAVQLTYTNLSLEEPEILFFDGLTDLYTFLVKHGKLHPKQWPEQWLLAEENQELRRLLIQEIY